MVWDWAVIGTAVGGFSTLIYTIFTYALLHENRALRKASSEPKVVAHFESHSAGNGALLLALSNVGSSPALDVSYSFEYDLDDFDNFEIIYRHVEERPAMTMIGQGQKFSFIFAIGYQLFRPKNASVSLRLKPFYVNVTWRSLASHSTQSGRYLLDVSAYEGLPGFIQKPPLVKIADELTTLNKHVRQLTSSQTTVLRTLETACLEQIARAATAVEPTDRDAD